jgi:hypothetical protein
MNGERHYEFSRIRLCESYGELRGMNKELGVVLVRDGGRQKADAGNIAKPEDGGGAQRDG